MLWRTCTKLLDYWRKYKSAVFGYHKIKTQNSSSLLFRSSTLFFPLYLDRVLLADDLAIPEQQRRHGNERNSQESE